MAFLIFCLIVAYHTIMNCDYLFVNLKGCAFVGDTKRRAAESSKAAGRAPMLMQFLEDTASSGSLLHPFGFSQAAIEI